MSLGLEVSPVGAWPGMVARTLSRKMRDGHGLRLCLATGETTRPVYLETVVLGEPEIFLLDEFGGLHVDDPARCAAMMRRDLPDQPFHAPDVDADDPAAAAAEYGRALDRAGVDLALVGLGRNGHLGMNEPGSTRQSGTRVVELAASTRTGALAYGASASPTWGITVGIRELMAARELWLVVSGGHKAGILSRTMAWPIGPELPATYLREHPNAIVLADSEAAAGL